MLWVDEWYYTDEEETEGDYYWYNPEGELVCDTDAEFYDVYFEGIVQGFYHSLIQDHGSKLAGVVSFRCGLLLLW